MIAVTHPGHAALPDTDTAEFRRKAIGKEAGVFTVYASQYVGIRDGRWTRTSIITWTGAGITAEQCTALMAVLRQAREIADLWDLEREGKTPAELICRCGHTRASHGLRGELEGVCLHGILGFDPCNCNEYAPAEIEQEKTA